MFKLLRKLAIVLALLTLGAVGYGYLSNPNHRRQLVQKAEELREDLLQGKKYAWNGPAVVVRALAGDTAVVAIEGSSNLVVRLAAIDAPVLPPKGPGKPRAEPQPLAQESRQYLAQLVENKAVEMSIVGVDSGKRPLVLLTLDGALINAAVVGAGLAEVTSEQGKGIPARLRHALDNAELSARQNRAGIWALTNYMRPCEYRIRHPFLAPALSFN